MLYAHAPITEAVIDVRVEPQASLQVDELRKVGTAVGVRYAAGRDFFRLTGALAVSANAAGVSNSSAVQREHAGFQFVGADEDRLFNVQLDGFSFNKLPPYESWERFRTEGAEIWSIYRGIAAPRSLTRLGLRYVNRLNLPLPFEDFRMYLNTLPEIGNGMPQSLSNFFMQLQIPHPEIEAMAILNMTLLQQTSENIAPIVLDIDIFRTQNIPQDEAGLWGLAEQLRRAKNAIFEACITDATRELFA